VAQKGPLQQGSLATAQELDNGLSPTGKQYSYQITTNLGTFSPTSTFTSQYIGVNATGYYFDEIANAVSGGTITLNGYSDLSADSVLNVNLLTSLAYQRIQTLVTKSNLSFSAARTQAESEVLAAFHIPTAGSYGAFGTLDLSKGRDGDHILAAISCLFLYGNTSGNLSALIANVQSDIGANGAITNATTQASLTAAAKALDPTAIAANLTAEYASLGVSFSPADISNWLDPSGAGIVERFQFQEQNATQSSAFSFPSYVASQFAGSSVSVTGGQLVVNGSPVSGPVTLKATDTLALSPGSTPFQQGLLTLYLTIGGKNVSVVHFVSGAHTLATLQSITVTPSPPALGVGTTEQLTATGTFADGTTGDVTTQVAWTSSNTSAVTVGASTGLATGVTLGSATITAAGGSVTTNLSATIVAPSWHLAAPAPFDPLLGPGATLLLNGKVLVAGGNIGASLPAPAELYDPISDSWSPPVTFASTALVDHSVTLLSDGRVLVAGGDDDRNYNASVASAELYDPAANVWSTATSLSNARESHTATLLSNGKVLVAGGLLVTTDGFQTSRVEVASAELYDPVANTWSPAGNLLTPRDGHTATLLPNGKVLVAGGEVLIAGGASTVTGSAELYDPVANTWSAAGDLVTPRAGHTATLLPNGKVLVAGGFQNYPTSLVSAELYDSVANTWSAANPLLTARGFHTATLLPNGKVLVVGGDSLGSSAELYDGVANIWSPTASLPYQVGGHTETLLRTDRFSWPVG
jgi:N-acetylneuraminic acid mutarotase